MAAAARDGKLLMVEWITPYWGRLPGRLRGWLAWIGNSKFVVGAAGLCFNERGELLLLEHVHHPECPWGLPGGWLQRGEHPAEGLAREIREECGLEASAFELLEVGGDGRHLTLYYRCRVPGGAILTLQPSEIRDYLWADPAIIPVRLRGHQRRLIEKYRAHATPLEER